MHFCVPIEALHRRYPQKRCATLRDLRLRCGEKMFIVLTGHLFFLYLVVCLIT
jgi:hypothetical protein